MGRHISAAAALIAAVAAIAAVLVVSGCSGSTRAHSSRASGDRDQPVLAVAAYNRPAYGREIQLVGLDGSRTRIDPHPPLPIDGVWSPDGTRIAFSDGGGPTSADTVNLYTANVDGSDEQLLYAAKGSYPLYPSWSPDGKWLAFTIDGHGPWIIGADGRGVHQVADLLIEPSQWVAWSPDGRTLALSAQDLKDKVESNEGVYTVSVDGTNLLRLTRHQTRSEIAAEAGIVDVEWSSDGKRIVFTRYRLWGAPDRVDVVNANGRNERRVDVGDCPVWSPDGRRLAYLASGGIGVARPGNPQRLIAKQKRAGCPIWGADGHRVFFFAGTQPYVANAETGAVRKQTATERKHVRLFSTADEMWSTDGKLLNIKGSFDDNDYVVSILTLHGTIATSRWSDDYAPAWSPDGRELAFVRLQGSEQIFVFDTVGKSAHRLAAGTNPAWSPDGKWIAFERKQDVFVVPARGGAPRMIGKGRHPVWSPDGASIAATGGGLFVMRRDGGQRHRIDRRGGAGCGGGAEPPSDRPAWSHEGRMLAFTYWCEADQAHELSVVGSDGTFQRVVGQGNSPQWSADDTWIVFMDESGQLVSIPTVQGSARVLVGESVKSFALSPDGDLVAYTLDVPNKVGSRIWLVRTDGSDRRPLPQSGQGSDLAWRP